MLSPIIKQWCISLKWIPSINLRASTPRTDRINLSVNQCQQITTTPSLTTHTIHLAWLTTTSHWWEKNGHKEEGNCRPITSKNLLLQQMMILAFNFHVKPLHSYHIMPRLVARTSSTTRIPSNLYHDCSKCISTNPCIISKRYQRTSMPIHKMIHSWWRIQLICIPWCTTQNGKRWENVSNNWLLTNEYW